jgi:hypothetical protein
MGGKMAQSYNIMPTTFILPQEYLQFVEYFWKVATEPLESR